jgi:hypothetical protein
MVAIELFLELKQLFKNTKLNDMKKIFLMPTIIAALLLVVGGCEKTEMATPDLITSQIENYDLIQLTNQNPDVPVQFTTTDNNNVDSVRVSIVEKGTINIVAFKSTKELAATNILKVPFPLPSVAPSGIYTIVVISIDKNGNDKRKSYDVSILNNKRAVASPCTFTDLPVPSGKNVMIRLSVPPQTNGDDVWMTGDWEGANGGNNWSGGDDRRSPFKMIKLSATCYYIFVNLINDNVFKFTRGDWGKVQKDVSGKDGKDFRYKDVIPTDNDFIYATGKYIDVKVENWADRTELPKLIMPEGTVVSGKMTILVNVDNTDTSKKYYLVKKGGNLSDQSIPMIRVKNSIGETTTRMAAAVPKDETTSYLVVRDDASQIGINAYGFQQEITWDGQTNPAVLFLNRYKNQGPEFDPINDLFLIGFATPGEWNNPVPVPEQKFTALGNGKFVINSISLKAGKELLFLPVNGDWGKIWGKGGDVSGQTGNIRLGGPGPLDIFTPNAQGNYKVEVDFYRGIYKLTKL